MYSGRQVDLGHLLPPTERRRKIEAAFKASGETLLRPVRGILGEDFSYAELQLVRMRMQQADGDNWLQRL